jgi:hypothetical protein
MFRASLLLGFLAAASAFTPGAYLPKANVRARGTAFVAKNFRLYCLGSDLKTPWMGFQIHRGV